MKNVCDDNALPVLWTLEEFGGLIEEQSKPGTMWKGSTNDFHAWLINRDRRRLTFCASKRLIYLFVRNNPRFWFETEGAPKQRSTNFSLCIICILIFRKSESFKRLSLAQNDSLEREFVVICKSKANYEHYSFISLGSIPIELKILRRGSQLLLQIERNWLNA